MILFDEIEKAHHDVFNIMLQILDDGRLTDSHGRTVNFKNTLIIMTSNICVDYASAHLKNGGSYSEMQEVAMHELAKHFRPEFLNRIDEIAIFHPLKKEQLVKIVDIKIADLIERVKQQRIRLEITDAAKKYLADTGYSETYGARPLQRVIQNEVETKVGKLIVSGTVLDGSKVVIDVGAHGIVAQVEKNDDK